MIASYYDGSDVLTSDNDSPNYFRISPSSVSRFFEHPRSWWGENFLSEPGFTGSTATVIGTINHYFAELAANNQQSNDPVSDVEQYLSTITHECDKDEVRTYWQEMSSVLIDGCVTGTTYHSTEQFIYHKLLPGIYVAGTYDAIVYNYNNELVLRDYKTSSVKPSGIPYNYRMQLHTYAYILRQKGIDIKYVELCYVTRPTKTLPPRYFNFIEPLTNNDLDKIIGQLDTIAHSVDHWNKHPEHRYLLAQDYRLKSLYKAPPKLFIRT